MKTAIANLRSVSPYSQSAFHQTPKLDKESADDYERRTWRERCHVIEDGHLFIPPMAFKNCLSEAAQFLSQKVRGKGQATWTKHFKAGVLVTDPLVLPIKKTDVPGEWLMMNANGKPGVGSRVPRCYPLIPRWSGGVTFSIIDNEITEAAFTEHLKQAGMLIGIGRFRPINRGFYGRFEVVSVEWMDQR